MFTATDVDHAHRPHRILPVCADAGVPELVRLASTIDRWTDELLAFHTTDGASNGPAEAVNLLIENARRVDHGFRNFNNYRLRLLLACGIKRRFHPSPESEAVNHAPPRRATFRPPGSSLRSRNNRWKAVGPQSSASTMHTQFRRPSIAPAHWALRMVHPFASGYRRTRVLHKVRWQRADNFSG